MRPCGPVCAVTRFIPRDLRRDFRSFIGRTRQLYAPTFAASSRMNLRFHHTHLGLQAPRGFPCFLFGERHVAAGSGDAVARENRLGLVFVNLHLRFCLLERSQFNRNRRTVRR